jgi:hypothetical protein
VINSLQETKETDTSGVEAPIIIIRQIVNNITKQYSQKLTNNNPAAERRRDQLSYHRGTIMSQVTNRMGLIGHEM